MSVLNSEYTFRNVKHTVPNTLRMLPALSNNYLSALLHVLFDLLDFKSSFASANKKSNVVTLGQFLFRGEAFDSVAMIRTALDRVAVCLGCFSDQPDFWSSVFRQYWLS